MLPGGISDGELKIRERCLVMCNGTIALFNVHANFFQEMVEIVNNAKHCLMVEALRSLVLGQIATAPFQLDGFLWCALPQPEVAAKLGTSVETLRRLIRKPPFVRDRALVGGTITCIIREGDPDVMTPRRMARILEKIWRDMTGIPTNAAQFGLFTGLAKDWPEGFQTALLKHVLSDWQLFMASVKFWIDLENMEADVENKPAKLYKRYYRFCSVVVIRRFWEAAIEAYALHLQEHDAEQHSTFMKSLAAKTKEGSAWT